MTTASTYGASDLERVSELRQEVEQLGIIRFAVSSRAELVEFSNQFGRLLDHRDADEDFVTVVKHVPELAGRAGYDALETGPLKPHTDGSGNRVVPKYITLWCESNEGSGGECSMADVRAVVASLEKSKPWVVEELAKPDVAHYRSGDEEYTGPVLWRGEDGEWRIRFRIDANGYFSAEAVAALQEFQKEVALSTFTFGLQRGEGYLIDNEKVLHGRTAFTGMRVMLRTLIA